MTLTAAHFSPLVALIAGILILIVPRLLNYIVAIYLIVIGLIGIFGWGGLHARTAEAVEEERRLLYVAVTRAREHLYLSWASARAAGGRSGRQRSRFLDGVRLGR